jgi:hypothetical protein
MDITLPYSWSNINYKNANWEYFLAPEVVLIFDNVAKIWVIYRSK